MPKRKLYDVSMRELKLIAKAMEKESKEFGLDFQKLDVPLGFRGHDRNATPQILKAVYRNRHFCAQIYEQGKWTRISVNRTVLDVNKNMWKEGITWDDLMRVKNQLGFGDYDAIEIYPKHSDIVDVSNMRHLFLVPEGINLSCIWRK